MYLLLILIFVKDLRKYLNIKKYGIEVKDANFKIVTLNNNRKVLKIHFNYKRDNKLVMITQQTYLFKAFGDTDAIRPEEWMNDIAWHNYEDALSAVGYQDIKKVIARAYSRLKQKGEI